MNPHVRTLCAIMPTVLLLALSGCALFCKPASTAPELEGTTPRQGSLDDGFGRIARTLPAFAGAFFDAQGVLQVRLVGATVAPVELATVRRAFDDARVLPTGLALTMPMVLRPAQAGYNWSRLVAYKTVMRDVLALPGVTLLDADERTGMVTVGIARSEARAAVEAHAARVGIPADAWTTVIAAPRRIVADLKDTFRPLVGGVQVGTDASFFGYGGACTLGFTAVRNWAPGFVTNSHCTRIAGGTEESSFAQSGHAPFNIEYVGHEAVDPPWTVMADCPTGRVCRRSDAAFVVVDIGNQNIALGSVARPAELCLSAPCSTAMNSATDRLALTGTAPPPMMGSFITKIGRTTGWTGGSVTRSCSAEKQFDMLFGELVDTGRTLLCQTEFEGVVRPGDSGSPVVVVGPDAPTRLPDSGTLGGIVWGSDLDLVGIFSPIDAVTAELGGLQLLPPASSPGGGPAPEPSGCVKACRSARDACMRNVADDEDGPHPSMCVAELNGCLRMCAAGIEP